MNADRNYDEERVRLAGPWRAVALALAVAGVACVAAVAPEVGRIDHSAEAERVPFSASYLVSYCFFLSLSLGAVFFVALQHLVRAGWSATVRRLSEILAANVLWMALLFLPILVPLLSGKSPLYEWSDPDVVSVDPLLQWKAPYLNAPFFTVRAVAYFVVWGLLAWFYLRTSCRQDDSGEPALSRRMERLAPVALILFGLTVTFAAFDWLMSLEPHWFSTIYGLYFFAGSVVGFLAALILLALALQATGHVRRSITREHYHELGKLLFGLVIFWGYIAFSQYLLIWYANIPEETVWYAARQNGPWAACGLALLAGHLFIPFFGLLPRAVKRHRMLLGGWAAGMLAVHWLDLYWLVMPTFAPDHLPLGWTEAGCFVGLGCLYTAGLLSTARGRPLVPQRDPRLGEALAFENP